MPNKYSHSVVLCNYASVGLIAPNDAFLASMTQRGRAFSSARDSRRTVSSRYSICSTTSSSYPHSTLESLASLPSQTIQSPRSFPAGRETPTIRIRSSDESLRQPDEPTPPRPSKHERPPLDTFISDTTVISPTSATAPESRQPADEAKKTDTWENDEEVALGVNCFQSSTDSAGPEKSMPNALRSPISSNALVKGLRSGVHENATLRRASVRIEESRIQPSETPSSPGVIRSNTVSPVTEHIPHPETSTRPPSMATPAFNSLPGESRLANVSSGDTSISPSQGAESCDRTRRYSLDSLSSLSSSTADDVPTLTGNAPTTAERSRLSKQFWDTVVSFSDTLALSHAPPALSTATSVDDMSSYPPDIPTSRLVYPSSLPGSPRFGSSTTTDRDRRREMVLTATPTPPSIPASGGRKVLQKQYRDGGSSSSSSSGRRNGKLGGWFGLGKVLRRKGMRNDDGMVRNSSGIVVGAGARY